jgi:hypothetical protein
MRPRKPPPKPTAPGESVRPSSKTFDCSSRSRCAREAMGCRAGYSVVGAASTPRPPEYRGQRQRRRPPPAGRVRGCVIYARVPGRSARSECPESTQECTRVVVVQLYPVMAVQTWTGVGAPGLAEVALRRGFAVNPAPRLNERAGDGFSNKVGRPGSTQPGQGPSMKHEASTPPHAPQTAAQSAQSTQRV